MPRIDLFYYGDVSDGERPADHYRDIEEQAILGDELGYDGIWVTEHHLDMRGEIPDPLLFLARISGLTKRLRLGTSVVCAPFYHPIRLAESAILLDTVSGGRLDLGVGSGVGDADFVRVWGVEPEETSARSWEVHEILRQAIDDGVVDFTGEYYEFHDVHVSPRSDRPARDLIWTAAGRNAIGQAKAHGYRLMIPRPLPLEERLRFNEAYREAVPDGEVIHLRSGLVGATEAQARRDALEFLRTYARIYLRLDWDGGPDSAQFDEIAEQLSFAIGTAPQVADRIRGWTDQFGGTEVTAIQFEGPGVPQSAVLRSIELFAAELPALKEHRSPVAAVV